MVVVSRSPREPGKAIPIRGSARTAKRILRGEPGKIAAALSSFSHRAWAACVRCGVLSGGSVICNSLSETLMSLAVVVKS